MRPTNRLLAVVCFLLMVLSISTPATAQIPVINRNPFIFDVEGANGTLKIRATLIDASCTGVYVLKSTLSPKDLDLSMMQRGQSRVFETGFQYQYGDLLSVQLTEVQSQATFFCPYWQGKIPEELRLQVDQNKEVGPPAHLSKIVQVPGKPDYRFDDSGGGDLKLRFRFKTPEGVKAYVVVYQTYPNGTSTSNLISLQSGGVHEITFSMLQATTNLPVRFVAVQENGISTAGKIYTP